MFFHILIQPTEVCRRMQQMLEKRIRVGYCFGNKWKCLTIAQRGWYCFIPLSLVVEWIVKILRRKRNHLTLTRVCVGEKIINVEIFFEKDIRLNKDLRNYMILAELIKWFFFVKIMTKIFKMMCYHYKVFINF